MKQFSKLFFAAAVAALGLASCAKEVAPVETPKDNLVTVHFGATAGIEGATKATLTTEDELTFTSAWENGDVLSVKYLSPANEEKIIPATWNMDSFEAALPDEKGEWYYQACYPKPDEKDNHIDFGGARTQNGNNYNSTYDVMICDLFSVEDAGAGKTADGSNVVFNMKRETAVAYFHLTDGPANEDLVSATLSVEGGFIASQHAYISDFAFAPTKDLTEITITFPEKAPKASDFQLWYNVLPTKYTKMTLKVETANQTLTISRNAPNIDEYVAGKLYKVSKDIPADKWVKKGGGETPKPSVIEDVLTADKFKADGTTYTAFTGVKATSPAVYAGSTAKNDSGDIQLRSSKSTDGIVTTTSGGSATRVSVVWGTGNAAYRAIDIYGKSTAYSKASDLYATQDGDQGTKIGSIICGTSTELVIEGDYPYIGIRSKSGALYLNSITITWGNAKTTLETPANLQINAAKVVSWDAVSGAASYNVTIGTETYTSNTNSYDAADIADDYYDVAVVAVPSDKDNYKNSAAATITGVKFGTPTLATPTLKEGIIDGASISVSWSVDERATAGYNCELFKGDVKVGEGQIVKVGSVTFTGLDAETAYVVKVNAVAVEGTKAYAASPVATLEVTTKAATAAANDGSLEHPYTAAEAIAAIKANTAGLTGKHVKGIVKATPSFNATYSSLTYDIESGEKTLYIYSGRDLGNADFVGAEDLKAGDEVVVLGTLKKYTDKAGVVKYELDKNNYLISINGETQIYRGLAVSGQKTAFTVGDAFEFRGKALQVWRGKADVDVTASATFSGYDMSTEGKQTVTVTVGEETVTYEINVRAAGGEAPKTYTLQFGTPYNSADEKIGSYTKTWNATRDGFTWTMVNWNNNNNGWKHVRAGNKTAASVATITTNTPIPEAISTITMTIDAIEATYVNSIKLEVLSADGKTVKETVSGTAKQGDCVFSITNSQQNCKYKITVDCKKGKGNGFVQVSKVVYTNN